MFTFKIKNQGISLTLEKKFRDQMEKVLSSDAFLKEVGQFAVERIAYQARTSKPLNESSSLPALKATTIAARRRIARNNPTHQAYEPARSNLTITGQFLNSLKYALVKAGVIKIGFDGVHKGYVNSNGGRGLSIANAKLAEYLSDKGFVVFDKSLQDNKTFKARIKSIALRYVRRGLAVSRRLRP